jgi:hypothetical protein
MQADQVLTKLSEATLALQNDNARNVRASFVDIVSDDDTISNHSQVSSNSLIIFYAFALTRVLTMCLVRQSIIFIRCMAMFIILSKCSFNYQSAPFTWPCI